MENLDTKVLVTGATGFIGSNLIKELHKKKDYITAVGRSGKNNIEKFCKKIIKSPFYELDWNLLGEIDILFHQAAINDTTITDEQKMFFVNSEAPINLFKEAISHGCKKIVYASSMAVYGNSPVPFIEGESEKPLDNFEKIEYLAKLNPEKNKRIFQERRIEEKFSLNAYGKSKLLLDKKAMAFAKRFPEATIVGLRYGNVFGPGESHKGKMANIIYQLAQQILQNKPKLFKYGEQKRDEIYIQDVITANLLALNAHESCILNCGSGKATSFNEMVKGLNKVLGTNKEIVYIENPYKSFFQEHTELDMRKTKEKIGFVPKFSFTKGLEDYYKSGELTTLLI